MSALSRDPDDSGRRSAWASWLLAVACLAGLFAAKAAELETQPLARAHLDATAAWFERRPYLEPPALLARHVEETGRADRAAKGVAAPEPDRVREEQGELDQRVAGISDLLEALPARRFELRPGEEPAPLRIALHWAFHAGWAHLFGNLLLLLWLGYVLEGAWGSARFVGVALVSTLAAAAAALLDPGGTTVSLGTSGLLAGGLGAYLVGQSPARGRGVYALTGLLGALVLSAPWWLPVLAPAARGWGLPDPLGLRAALPGGLAAGVLTGWALRLRGAPRGVDRRMPARRTPGRDPARRSARSVSTLDFPLGDATEEPAAPDGVVLAPGPRQLAVLQAVPLDLDGEGLQVELDGGTRKRLRFERIEAVAAAHVGELGRRPVLVADIVLNWLTHTEPRLKLVRLRSDRLDARSPGSQDRKAAERLIALVEELLERSDAAALPDEEAARGRRALVFGTLAEYHRDVLRGFVEEPDEA